jgi:hypothetical protein
MAHTVCAMCARFRMAIHRSRSPHAGAARRPSVDGVGYCSHGEDGSAQGGAPSMADNTTKIPSRAEITAIAVPVPALGWT